MHYDFMGLQGTWQLGLVLVEWGGFYTSIGLEAAHLIRQHPLFAHPLLFLAWILFFLSLLSSLLDHLFKFKNTFLFLKKYTKCLLANCSTVVVAT